MKVRKKWWLAPIIILLLLLGFLIIFTEGSALAPFIYTLFWFSRNILKSILSETNKFGNFLSEEIIATNTEIFSNEKIKKLIDHDEEAENEVQFSEVDTELGFLNIDDDDFSDFDDDDFDDDDFDDDDLF